MKFETNHIYDEHQSYIEIKTTLPDLDFDGVIKFDVQFPFTTDPDELSNYLRFALNDLFEAIGDTYR